MSRSAPVTLFHGTLARHMDRIMHEGIEEGEGWGGAGTSGVFLSRSPEGALYWAKLAHQREHEELLEISRFDRKHGKKADRLLAVLEVEIPPSELHRLKADEEQFEDVAAEVAPDDWEASLVEIGDVRFEGRVPAGWIRGILLPSEIERRSR